jgi:uncharacterized membrane protein
MTEMTRFLIAYGATAFVMVALDMLWLGVVAKPLYTQGIGHLMAAQPNVAVAVGFYLLYAAGLVVFGVWPTADVPGWTGALLKGALFGFFAYATYDLTNLATLKDWPVGLSLIDITWGTCVSGVSAAAGKWALDRFASA